jgi:hypothetical protein
VTVAATPRSPAGSPTGAGSAPESATTVHFPAVAPERPSFGEACPLCGAPLAPEQDWCLNCGAAARTRLAATPNWKAPIAALAVIAALALGVLAAALVKLAEGSGSKPPVTTTVTTPAASTPVTPATTATPGASTPGVTTPGASTPGASVPGTSGSATTPGGAGAPSAPATTPTGAAKGTSTPKSKAGFSPAELERIRKLLKPAGK